jgi:replication-associated recombination protein RarA
VQARKGYISLWSFSVMNIKPLAIAESRNLDEYAGQEHILVKANPLRRAIEVDRIL